MSTSSTPFLVDPDISIYSNSYCINDREYRFVGKSFSYKLNPCRTGHRNDTVVAIHKIIKLLQKSHIAGPFHSMASKTFWFAFLFKSHLKFSIQDLDFLLPPSKTNRSTSTTSYVQYFLIIFQTILYFLKRFPFKLDHYILLKNLQMMQIQIYCIQK